MPTSIRYHHRYILGMTFSNFESTWIALHGAELGLNIVGDGKGSKLKLGANLFKKLKAGGKPDPALRDKHAKLVLKHCESYAEEVEVSNHLLKQYVLDITYHFSSPNSRNPQSLFPSGTRVRASLRFLQKCRIWRK